MAVVLAPIDGSPRALRALPWAAKLAGPNGTVVLLRVVPPQPSVSQAMEALAGEGEADLDHLQGAWAATATADLDQARKALEGSTVAIADEAVAGEADEAIVAAAERLGADFIAMASHGRGAIGRAIFGSVADRVTRESTVPVLVLRAADAEAAPEAIVRRIVVPLDGSPLARRALPIAAALAKAWRAPVHIVRAIDPATTMPVAPGVFGPAPVVSAELADRVWREAEAEARQTVADAVTELQTAGVEATGGILNGSPFFAISEATHPGDLLVLTSHGRGGVRRWLLGSVAEKLVREAPAPVLLVPSPERAEKVAELAQSQTSEGGSQS
jgi:nucleotide-binding universal stress UspA family protein